MPEEKVPRILFYALGEFGLAIPIVFIPSYVFLFFSISEHSIPETTLGIILGISTLVPGIIQPLYGLRNDLAANSVKKLRRTVAFLSIPAGISFLLIWVVSSVLSKHIAIVEFILLLVFQSLFSLITVAYYAIFPQITSDNRNRVRGEAWQFYFSMAGTIFVSAGPALLLYLGYGIELAAVVSSILMTLTLLSVIGTGDTNHSHKGMPHNIIRADSFKRIAQALKNRNMLLYMATFLAFQFAIELVLLSLGYIMNILVFPNSSIADSMVGVFELVAIVAAILLSPLMVRHVDKRGFKSSYLTFGAAFAGSSFFMSTLGLPSFPWNFLLLFTVAVSFGFGFLTLMILPSSVLSNIIDEAAIPTGERNDGFFFGMQGLFGIIGMSMAQFFVGIFLAFTYLKNGSSFYVRLLPVVAGVSIMASLLIFNKIRLLEKKQ